MKPEELRLGSLVLHNGKVTEVTMARYIGDFADEKIKLEPIPLTEEWLLKLGFKQDNFGVWSCGNLDCDIEKYEEGYVNSINSDEYINGQVIKYVHQLQNLCFALTGEEIRLHENQEKQ